MGENNTQQRQIVIKQEEKGGNITLAVKLKTQHRTLSGAHQDINKRLHFPNLLLSRPSEILKCIVSLRTMTTWKGWNVSLKSNGCKSFCPYLPHVDFAILVFVVCPHERVPETRNVGLRKTKIPYIKSINTRIK